METSLSQPELMVIYDTLKRAEEAQSKGIHELSDIFTEDARLIITPSNRCVASCLHCVADSIPKGSVMPYDKFIEIDHSFFEIFKAADFGRRGNPLLYHSNGHDLADMMKFLNDHGIAKFTLASAIQVKYVPVMGRLEDFVLQRGAEIETMVTYHHYFADLDTTKLAQDFNAALKNYLRFSKRIVISLLGDKYSQQRQSSSAEVEETFNNHKELIFAGLDIVPCGDYTYQAEYMGKQAEIYIPPVDTRVYPFGRFRNYLSQHGILEQYEHDFEQSMSDYVCPDLIKWPGIIIEPDGSLNLCASFEAIVCNGAIISNIFTQPFGKVKQDLIQFHRRELDWFANNLPGIIAGDVSTCKLKNNCYRN